MGEPGCPLLAANEECIWTIMHRCEAPDLLRLALTCKRLHASALALAEAKLLRRWPRWRRRMAGGTSVLVQLVVSELSCMLAVGGTWKPEDYWGAEASSADSATDSVEAAFVLLPTPGLLPEGERRFGMWGGAGAITTGSGPSEAEPDGAAGDTAAPICAELSIDWLGGVRPLPFAWRRGCTVSVRNLVFVAGGCIRNAQTRLCYAYAPELDKWMQAPSLERKRNVAAAALHLGGAWVVGGYDGKLHLASTEHLTPPADHAHVADADSDGQGDGDGLDGPLAEAEGDRSAHGRSRPPDEEGEEGEIADELRSWRWRQAPSLLTARSSLGVASVRGTLYAVGGYGPAHDAPTATATALRSAEMLRRGAGAWEALPSLSEGRSDLALVAYAGHLYAIGGSTTVGRPTPLVERLRVPARDTPPADSDDDGFAWERLPQLLVPRSGAGAAVVAGRLVVVGGKGPSNVRLSSVEVLCQGAGRWLLAQSNPPPQRPLALPPPAVSSACQPPSLVAMAVWHSLESARRVAGARAALPAASSSPPPPSKAARIEPRCVACAGPFVHNQQASVARSPSARPTRGSAAVAAANAAVDARCATGKGPTAASPQLPCARPASPVGSLSAADGPLPPEGCGPPSPSPPPRSQPSSGARADNSPVSAGGSGSTVGMVGSAGPLVRRRPPARVLRSAAVTAASPVGSPVPPAIPPPAPVPPPPPPAMQRSFDAKAVAGGGGDGGGDGGGPSSAGGSGGGAGPSDMRVLTCETRHAHLLTPRDAFGLVALRPAYVGWLDTDGGGAHRRCARGTDDEAEREEDEDEEDYFA